MVRDFIESNEINHSEILPLFNEAEDFTMLHTTTVPISTINVREKPRLKPILVNYSLL